MASTIMRSVLQCNGMLLYVETHHYHFKSTLNETREATCDIVFMGKCASDCGVTPLPLLPSSVNWSTL
jgi:hypothetical protein